MNGLEDVLMDAVLAVVAEKVDFKTLQKTNTISLRKKLLKRFTNDLFYMLLTEKRVDLAPGFGRLILKEIKEKDKKVYDKKTKTMVVKHVRGKKVVYIPGDVLKEFL